MTGGATWCHHCLGALVGPGGVRGKQPLFFSVLLTPVDRMPVRVHRKCVKDAQGVGYSAPPAAAGPEQAPA